MKVMVVMLVGFSSIVMLLDRRRRKQISGVAQQLINTVQSRQLLFRNPLRVLLLMSKLQLQCFLTLLELDQSLRQGCDRLCQVLGRACDPEGNGSSHTGTESEIGPMTAHGRASLKIRLNQQDL